MSPLRETKSSSQTFTFHQTPRRFRFDRDSLDFANWTVWNYQGGRVVVDDRAGHKRTDRYTRRCFVMSRTAQQFYKFARFDPRARPLNDVDLARRVRQLTAIPPWHAAYQPNERIVFPGYANVRQLSRARMRVLQENIGLGWPTYLRVGNARMVFQHSRGYQEETERRMAQAVDRGELFIGFLSDFPTLHINHAVLVYGRANSPNGRRLHAAGAANSATPARTKLYLCYDPNHPESPRHLTWFADRGEFAFEKDPEFAGGFTRVYQVYGAPLQ